MKAILRSGLVAAAAFLTIAAPAHALQVVHVGKAARDAAPTLATDVGVATGIFKKHGLDVEISDFSGGGKMHQAEAAGSIDIGVGAGPELALIAKGSPELAICDCFPPPSFIAVMVPADSPIHRVAQLKGKRIGVSSAGGLTYWLALELARTQGWGPDGVHVVAIGNGAASIVSAFKTHAVDADIGPSAVAFNLGYHKGGRLLIPVSKYEGNMGAGMVFATDRFIAAHPDAIRRFMAGWFETIAWMRAHKAGTVKIESKVTGFPLAVQAKEYDLNIGGFSKTGKFDKQSLANLERSFIALKLLETKPDMSKLYTERFLPKS